MRLFVGDVQGCAEPLDRLLVAAGFDAGTDRLVLCGDLVNKGPDSVGVLRRVRDLGAESVLGNHDVALLDVAAGRRKLKPRHTFTDVLEAPDRDELLGWLAQRPLLWCEEDVWVVHAGLHPGWDDLEAVARRLRVRFDAALATGVTPFDEPEIRFALTARYCSPEGEIADPDWPEPPPPYRPWMDYYSGDEMVVYGHWARAGLHIGRRTRGLDTGCVYGHALTGWIAESDRVVSVPRDP